MKVSPNALHRLKELAWETSGIGTLDVEECGPEEPKAYQIMINDIHGEMRPSIDDLKKMVRKHQEAVRCLNRILGMVQEESISLDESMTVL